jgi:hypothetical protein
MRLAWIDKHNNIIHLCDPNMSLQDNFDRFEQIVRVQGKRELCVGDAHLVQVATVSTEGHSTLHFNRDRPSRWDVNPPPGLVWPGGTDG